MQAHKFEENIKKLKKEIRVLEKDKLADELISGKLNDGFDALIDLEDDSVTLKIHDSKATLH